MNRQNELDAIVVAFRTVHPEAEPVNEWDMDGWAVEVQDAPKDWVGTMDSTRLMVFPLERKSGITVHIWDPRDPGLLKSNDDLLEEAGFKVMAGCLQWNRKAPVDADALQRLFEATA